ncbi:hypothetical protein [Ensifer canadensis]
MRVSMEAVAEENRICEAAICYTGDILNAARRRLMGLRFLKADLEPGGRVI